MDSISNKMNSSRKEICFLENENVYENNWSRRRTSYLAKSYAHTVIAPSRDWRQSFHLLMCILGNNLIYGAKDHLVIVVLLCNTRPIL